MPVNSIEWLQQWYTAQCDDKWEHQHGITIQTLDNPGWLVKVDLIGTSLQGTRMREVGDLSTINHKGIKGHHDWVHCKVEDNHYIGAGGPSSLLTICEVFRQWVEDNANKPR